MESVRLQLKTGGIPVVLHLSQYDSDREYIFTPYYGAEAYAYQSGAHVYIEATKPDKTVVNTEMTYNEDGTVTYKLTDSLTQAAGDVRAKLTWVKDGLRLASAAVVFACDAAGINSYARVSESDLETLHNAESKLYDLDGYVSKAESAATRAEAATGDIQSVADKAIEDVEAATTTAIAKIDGAGTTAVDAAAKAKEYAETARSAEEHVTAAQEKATAAAEAAALSETHAAASEEHAKASEQAAALSETHAATSEQHAAESEKQAELSESWAVGGTGKREGEDKNNAKYWASVAAGAVAGVATFNGRSGNVTPQTGDYSYSQISGTPTAATSSTDGLMSKSDKAKLDGIAEGATAVIVDNTVAKGSANAVSGGGVYTAIETETSARTAADSALDSRATSLETAVNTLNGTGEGSVSKAVSDGIAKVVADAPASFDTLKEISDWITTHSEDAAAMNSQIETNKSNISANTTAVSAEETARKSADSALETKISALLTPVRLGIKTLAAGETSLSWTSDVITNTCVIDVYCSINGVAPTAQEQSGTTYTVTFDAQSADMQVDAVVIP